MKVPLEKIIESPSQSITSIVLKEPYFDPNWHFHPHYQLFTVVKGKGTRLIGDSVEHFEEGDAVLLAPNLPHLWRNDEAYFKKNSGLSTEGIVTYFTEDFLSKSCSFLPEARGIKQLLQNSHRGVSFKGKTAQILSNGLKKLGSSNGYDSILLLLSLLHELSQSNEFDYITSIGYRNTHKLSETERMHKVLDHVMKNYSSNITLNSVADIANMTIPAFCRYFKKRTNKTFSEFVAEIRIGNACKALSDHEDFKIVEICYANGFNSLSNFNRVFKEVKGCTPSEYKRSLNS